MLDNFLLTIKMNILSWFNPLLCATTIYKMAQGIVYLLPTVLHEEGLNAIPAYILNAIKDCQVFFVENEVNLDTRNLH